MNKQRGQFIVALVLIVLGVVFLLGNLDIIDVDIGDLITTWWPLILISLGVTGLFQARTAPIGSIFLIFIGVVFLLITLDVADYDILWPIVIIAAGIWVLFQNRISRRSTAAADVGQDSVNVSALFSGSVQRITSQSFQGGNVSATFGGVELDMRGARLAENSVLNINVFMGGVELRVPDEWLVNVNGSPVLGAIEYSRSQPAATDDAPTLTINASVTLGGLDIKS